MTKIMVVNFRGDELYGVELAGIIYVALKPIVAAMGLDWNGQYQRVKRDEILSEGMCMIHIPSARGGTQQTVCLRLDLVNGWLFTIDADRVRDEVRPRVLDYQRECYAVLHRHFVAEGVETVKQANETDSLHIRMVSEARQVFGISAAAQLWKQLGLPLVPAMNDGDEQIPLPLDYKQRA